MHCCSRATLASLALVVLNVIESTIDAWVGLLGSGSGLTPVTCEHADRTCSMVCTEVPGLKDTVTHCFPSAALNWEQPATAAGTARKPSHASQDTCRRGGGSARLARRPCLASRGRPAMAAGGRRRARGGIRSETKKPR